MLGLAQSIQAYFFEVLNDSFLTALAQFADTIHAPLILPSACEKERNAIDAEFKLKLKDDSRRIYQVHKEACNPAHPFAKFSVGNHQTLSNTKKLYQRRNKNPLLTTVSSAKYDLGCF